MIIAFETKPSSVLNEFLERYENPESISAQLSKNSFLEFKIHRIKDLIIIQQKHLFDVVAKWIFMCAFADLVIAYVLGNIFLYYMGGIFCLISIMWLSKYIRFYALRFNIKRKGHKDNIEYVNDVLVIEKLLLDRGN